MITLRQLEVFAEVVRSEGSVTQAAARLYVSQPSVSDTLRALEKSTGAKMFSGRGKARALTAAGETYWGYTNRILRLVDDAAQAVADLAETPRGRLSIVAVPTAGERIVPPVLRSFVDAHPEVGVTMMVANRADATEVLREGSADVAIMGRPPASLGADDLRFGENPLLLVCSSTHDLASGPRKLHEITAYPFLLREQGSGTRAVVEELFDTENLKLDSTMILGSNNAILAAVREGLGVAVLPTVAADELIREGHIVSLGIDPFPIMRSWHAVWLRTRPPSSPAQAFISMLRKGQDDR